MGSSASAASLGSSSAAGMVTNSLSTLFAGTHLGCSSSSSGAIDERERRRLARGTQLIVDRFRNPNLRIKITEVQIWCRPIASSSTGSSVSSDEEKSGGGQVVLAMGGVLHTFIILISTDGDYWLDRVQEGIRCEQFTALEQLQNTPCIARLLRNEVTLNASVIADFIDDERREGYSLTANNCIHFAYHFTQISNQIDNFFSFSRFWTAATDALKRTVGNLTTSLASMALRS